MRLVLIVVIIALLLLILGFAMTNLETKVPITIWQSTYQNVPLWSVVFVAVLVGIVSVGIIGVVDGAFIRLRNRQLAKENRRIETELNWLRTQPAPGRLEPDVPIREDADEAAERAGGEGDALEPVGIGPASAPVYQPDEEPGDEGDDPYSGGRAV
jgi:uncharacterized integral membrane protein